MKNLKKVLAFALAVVLMLSLCTVAFAANTSKAADLTNHTYTLYKIFAGTQTTTDDTAELGNISWGDGIDSTSFLVALKADNAFKVNDANIFANCSTAAEVAEVLSNYDNGSGIAKEFARIAENNKAVGTAYDAATVLDPGYYLVVDTTSGSVEAYNIALLQLTKKGTFDIANKVDVPQVEKKVSDDLALNCNNEEEGHTHTKDCYHWTDANKVAIGDTVHYEINTAVPAAAADYDYYYFIIRDTLSNGLTLVPNSFKVYINGASCGNTEYTIKTGSDAGSYSFQIALTKAKAHAGESVVVTYDATLNNNAVVGTTGNPNEVDVQYSNKPDTEYDGTKDSNNPGFPDSNKDVPTGETPKDYTITYTTQLKIFKVDENEHPLNGAQFTLTGNTLNKVLVYKEVFTEDANGSYYKLMDGTYTTNAPVIEDTVRQAEAGAEAGYVVAEEGYTGEDAVTVSEVTYRPYKPAEDEGETVFVLVLANSNLYDSPDTKYSKGTSTFTEVDAGTDENNSKLHVAAYVDDNGEVIFTGLNAGEYTLEETVIPDGYNPIDTINFTIDWTEPENVNNGTAVCTWSTTNESPITYVPADNAFEITIENKKGSTLPETGGIGTTIFYVIGGILLAGAAVLLITKKRMSSEV